MMKNILLFLCCILFLCLLIYNTANLSFSEKYITSLFGFLGVIIGSVLITIGNIINEWYKNRDKKNLDNQRKEILKKMLNHPKYTWRNINTLSNVIGATKEETKRLLIEIDARGSENNTPEKELWALIKKQPLPNIE